MAGVMKINYDRSLKRIGEFVSLGDIDWKNKKAEKQDRVVFQEETVIENSIVRLSSDMYNLRM